MASIEKRQTKQGIRYRARITLKGHPRLSETFATRREAVRWSERTTEALRSRRFNPESESEQRTVGDLVDRFMLEKLPQLAHPTQNRRKLNWWRDQLGEDTRLSQVTPAAIAAARDRLTAGESLSGKKPSASTVRRYLNVLGSMMGTATREWFWLDSNPCRKVVRPREPRGRARCLAEDEQQRLLRACEDSEHRRLYPLVVTALCTGARQGELLNLPWHDVALDRGLAILHDTKNGERRALAITGLAKPVLREWSKVRRIDSALVFPNARGTASFPQKAWKRALEAAGIEDFRFHDLRHTFASYVSFRQACAGPSFLAIGTTGGVKSTLGVDVARSAESTSASGVAGAWHGRQDRRERLSASERPRWQRFGLPV